MVAGFLVFLGFFYTDLFGFCMYNPLYLVKSVVWFQIVRSFSFSRVVFE